MLSPIHKYLIYAAQSAGDIVYEYFLARQRSVEKSEIIDLLYKANTDSLKECQNIVQEKVPDYNLILPAQTEGAKTNQTIDKKSAYTVAIQTVDGATNFKLGIPYFAGSITLLKNNQAVFTVIYNPVTKQTFYAIKGEGAWMDSHQLQITPMETSLGEAMFAYTSGYGDDWRFFTKLRQQLIEAHAGRVLNNWCSTLDYCLLASGTIDCLINYNDEFFDFMAGKLLLREAGALVTNFNGEANWFDNSSLFVATYSTDLLEKMKTIIATANS